MDLGCSLKVSTASTIAVANRNFKVHVMGLISRLLGECVCPPWQTLNSKGEAGYFDPLNKPGSKVVCLVWDFSSWWPEVGIERRPTAAGRSSIN